MTDVDLTPLTYRNRRSSEEVEVLRRDDKRVQWKRPSGAICEATPETFEQYFEGR